MSAAELPLTASASLPQADMGREELATLWQRCCARLAAELPEQQFNTWIRPLPAAEVSREGGLTVVCVRVPNRFMLDWIRTQYSARIEAILAELQPGEVRMDIALAPRAALPVGGTGVRPGMVLPGRALPPNAPAAASGAAWRLRLRRQITVSRRRTFIRLQTCWSVYVDRLMVSQCA